jgi:heavy metal translocating P-type ATPase
MSKQESLTFNVSGMHCASCAANTKRKLSKTPGVATAEVSYATHEAKVTYDPDLCTPEDMDKAVASLGYGTDLTVISHNHEGRHQHIQAADDLKIKLMVSVALTIPLLVAMIPGVPMWFMDPRLQLLLATPVQFWVGKQYYLSAWKALKNGMTNMDTLIVLGTTVAYAFSVAVMFFGEELRGLGIEAHVYFETAAAIITFIMVGKYLEAKATGQTSRAIEKLLDLQVKQARVIRDGTEEMIDVGLLQIGDLIKVKPGEKIPVDGVISKGMANLDESMVTGESVPVAKITGDEVIGATINTNSTIEVIVTKLGDDTFLSQVISLVKSAQASKAPIQKLVDKVASIFVPSVIILAIITFIIWWIWGPDPALVHALVAMISVLIIACPCALGLATPVSIMVGVGKGAELGILIKDAENLEVAGKIKQVIFDKTGTLTEGKPALQKIYYASGTNETLIDQFIYSLEKESHHPLAEAVVTQLSAKTKALSVKDFKDIAGKGVMGTIKNRKVLIGTIPFMTEKKVALDQRLAEKADELANSGNSVSMVALDGKHVVALGIADTVRAGSKAAVIQLKELGVSSLLLTGDNKQTARAVASEVGISDVKAEVLPQDKQEVVMELKKSGTVGMVGDGINDAPALAAADIGIAMGMGTDIAIETAGITLLRSDISLVPKAILLSRLTLSNIGQNLAWAFGYNIILIPVAMGVLYPTFGIQISPILASAAMAFSSVSVVLNALRLKRKQL